MQITIKTKHYVLDIQSTFKPRKGIGSTDDVFSRVATIITELEANAEKDGTEVVAK